MARRSWFPALVIAVPFVVGACAGGGTSGDAASGDTTSGVPVSGDASIAAAPAEALSSVATASSMPAHEAADPARFRQSMQNAHEMEKAGRVADAESVYQEALARTNLTNEQRAMAQFRMGRLRLEAGRLDEARMYANQALVLRPGWGDATSLIQKIDDRAAKAAAKAGAASTDAPGETAPVAKGDRKKKDGTAPGGKDGKREGKDGKKAAVQAGGAEQEMAALRKRSAAIREQLHQMELERDLLKGRVRELESQLAALKKQAEPK